MLDGYPPSGRVDPKEHEGTSSLAMKTFLPNLIFFTSIPTLNNTIDSKIRSSYYSGATNVYIKYMSPSVRIRRRGQNLYFYDVNSLYPYVIYP